MLAREDCRVELDELEVGDARSRAGGLEDAFAVAKPAVGGALVKTRVAAGGKNRCSGENCQSARERGAGAIPVTDQGVKLRGERGDVWLSRSMAACTKAIRVWPLWSPPR